MTMRSIVVFLALILFLALNTVVDANELSFSSFQELTRFALEHNQSIKNKKAVWEASLNDAQQMAGLPNPKVGVRVNGLPSKVTGQTADQTRFIVSQSFPFFGQRSRIHDLGDEKAKLAYLNYLQEKNQLLHDLHIAVYNLQLTGELIEITKKNKNLIEKLINITNVKYQSGKGLQANLLTAKVSKGKLENQLLALSYDMFKTTEQLRRLINSADASFDIKSNGDDSASLTLRNFDQSWVDKTLSVRIAEQYRDVFTSSKDVAEDLLLPHFSGQVEAWDNSGSSNQAAGQVLMTVPWFNQKNHRAITSAKHISQASHYALEDQKSKTQMKLANLLEGIKTKREMIQLFESNLLKNARLALSNLQKAFEVDKATFIDFFEAEQSLFELEKEQAILKNDLLQLITDLKWQFEKGELPNETVN